MTTKKIVIEKMHKKFPAHSDLVNELYAESESFRTLCEDYIDCQSVMDRLKYNQKMIQCNALEEYEKLAGELEEEIISRIDDELSEK